jgi:Domain of unknown function (DUF4349)
MRSTFFLLLALPVCLGCGKQANSTFTTVGNCVGSANPSASGKSALTIAENAPDAQEQGDKAIEQIAKKPRKIRYTANLSIIVDDFDRAWEGLKSAMKEAKTEPAQEDINTSPGSPRSGTWRIRVPVDLLDSFRSAITKLGDVERNALQSEDMTAQYYDLEAHIANRNTERETLRELLKQVGTKDIKHYLEVKRELDAITDDINRKEGQLRLWKNQTDLTTVTVNLREKQKYVPEEKAKDREVPTFGMRADKTWHDSWKAFLGFGEWLILAAITLTPWLPVPVVLLGLLILATKLTARFSPKPKTPVAETSNDDKTKNDAVDSSEPKT